MFIVTPMIPQRMLTILLVLALLVPPRPALALRAGLEGTSESELAAALPRPGIGAVKSVRAQGRRVAHIASLALSLWMSPELPAAPVAPQAPAPKADRPAAPPAQPATPKPGDKRVFWPDGTPEDVQVRYTTVLQQALGIAISDPLLDPAFQRANLWFITPGDFRKAVKEQMKIDPARFDGDSFTVTGKEADGTIVHRVYLDAKIFQDQMGILVGTVAHELHHVRLWMDGKRFAVRAEEEVTVCDATMKTLDGARERIRRGFDADDPDGKTILKGFQRALDRERVLRNVWQRQIPQKPAPAPGTPGVRPPGAAPAGMEELEAFDALHGGTWFPLPGSPDGVWRYRVTFPARPPVYVQAEHGESTLDVEAIENQWLGQLIADPAPPGNKHYVTTGIARRARRRLHGGVSITQWPDIDLGYIHLLRHVADGPVSRNEVLATYYIDDFFDMVQDHLAEKEIPADSEFLDLELVMAARELQASPHEIIAAAAEFLRGDPDAQAARMVIVRRAAVNAYNQWLAEQAANLLTEHTGPMWIDTTPTALLALVPPDSPLVALVRTTIPVADARRERDVFKIVREILQGGGLEEGIRYYAKASDAVAAHPALRAVADRRAREGRPIQGVVAVTGVRWFGVFDPESAIEASRARQFMDQKDGPGVLESVRADYTWPQGAVILADQRNAGEMALASPKPKVIINLTRIQYFSELLLELWLQTADRGIGADQTVEAWIDPAGGSLYLFV